MNRVEDGFNSFLQYQIEQYIRNVCCSLFLKNRFDNLFDNVSLLITENKFFNLIDEYDSELINIHNSEIRDRKEKLSKSKREPINIHGKSSLEKNQLKNKMETYKHTPMREVLSKLPNASQIGINGRISLERWICIFLRHCLCGKEGEKVLRQGFYLYHKKNSRTQSSQINWPRRIKCMVKKTLPTNSFCKKIDLIVTKTLKDSRCKSDFKNLPEWFDIKQLLDMYLNMKDQTQTLNLAVQVFKLSNKINKLNDDNVKFEEDCRDLIEKIIKLELEGNPFSPIILPFQKSPHPENYELLQWIENLDEDQFLERMKAIYRENRTEIIIQVECRKFHKWFKSRKIFRDERSLKYVIAALYCLQQQHVNSKITVEQHLEYFLKKTSEKTDSKNIFSGEDYENNDLNNVIVVKSWINKMSPYIRKENSKFITKEEFPYSPMKSFTPDT